MNTMKVAAWAALVFTVLAGLTGIAAVWVNVALAPASDDVMSAFGATACIFLGGALIAGLIALFAEV